ncbi:floral homeotic protein HUA1 [Prunus dulcis]|uniref:Floral homeotic protein HUA1 n=1 Tax=Prunus dulcis TaxID=3755 RepID=A0A4Y1RZL8_PRUDU|nr:floral homeotic protein HUA1 [Prunus dulcis]
MVIEGRPPSPLAAISAISTAELEFVDAVTATRLDCPSPTLVETASSAWIPLVLPRVKINLDVAWSPTSNQGGIGLVVRDYMGTFILAMSIPCMANFAQEAEALAAVEACSLTIEHEFRHVQFESDYLEVVVGSVTTLVMVGYGAAQSAAADAAATAGLSSVYTSCALNDSYLSDLTLRYLSWSDPSASATDHHSRSSSMYLATSHLMSHRSRCRARRSLVAPSAFLSERPGEPDCPVASENSNVFALPERPSELPCAIPSAKQENKIGEIGTTIHLEGTGFAVKPPALSFNSKGLPVSPGEPDCPFYLKTGSCKYGATWARLKRIEKAL